jgi:dolichol-phosphate mannosyltransferase
MLALALDGLTGFSVAPLRAISLIAVLTMMASFLLLAFSIYAWIALPVVPGWTSLFALILFMSSLQLLALGVIGEYVGRTFMEAKRRPTALLRCIKRGRPQ